MAQVAGVEVTYGEVIAGRARLDVGVREVGRNRGPRVDAMLRGVGIDPTTGQFAWCASAVYAWCAEAAQAAGGVTTCSRSGGAIKQFQVARKRGEGWDIRSPKPLAVGDVFYRVRHDADPVVMRALARRVIEDGMIKPGHTGVIVGFKADGTPLTIEGNTNVAGSREGDGVYERELDFKDPALVGFARYSVRMPRSAQ